MTSRRPLLGCIADDFTGATDLAGMLVGAGMRTVQMIGVPQQPVPEDVDAVVIALKSRTNAPEEAVAQSLAALAWLRSIGCRQFYFKYCSTFDSTDRGNIGPVTDALMTAMDTDFTIACPAFPANKRAIFKGHLFVGDALLGESGMQHHPLTPMTDSNLVRVLQAQTDRRVGLIGYEIVSRGAAAIEAEMAALRNGGVGIAIVDAISNADLMEIGAACRTLPLVTAGSGLAIGLPQNFPDVGDGDGDGIGNGIGGGSDNRDNHDNRTAATAGAAVASGAASSLPDTTGLRAIISGSCSTATQAQVAHAIASGMPAFAIDPFRLAAGEDLAAQALAWSSAHLANGPVLIHATAAPEAVKLAQAAIGVEQAGALVEKTLAEIAAGLVDAGVRQLIVAGGETSGAVVNALRIEGLRIGPQIDPGVPWTAALGPMPLALALKSGNFGSTDFFIKAWGML